MTTPDLEIVPSEPRLVVGVATSMADRSAIERLLSLSPAWSGISIILHFSPPDGSPPPHVLAPCVSMRVTDAASGERLRANTLYLSRDDAPLELRGGRVQPVEAPAGSGLSATEHLLVQLAREVGPRAIAVFLSGTAGEGVRALRDAGGLAIAARPAPGVEPAGPRSAFDLILDVEDMPRALSRFAELATALRESEARFREMADGLPLIVWVHGPEGEQELVNDTFCEYFAVSREEMKGGRWQMLVHPDDAEPYTAEFLSCLAERRPFHAQVRVVRGDGEWRWLESWGRPRFTETGEFRGMVGTSADITERKQMDERLRESDRRKDEYMAMLGHELRNPLAAIRHATELIEIAGVRDTLVERALGVLGRQTAHMTRLLDGLLEVSRIARGKIDLALETVDLRHVLAAVLEDRAAEIERRGLEVERVLGGESLWVHGDPVRLAQVFDNVLVNAIKFTEPPGAVTIVGEREGDEVVARIRDTGSGIRPELLERVFEPFQQGAQDVSRAAGGLGLGLALAHGLIDLHRGSIEARSGGLGAGTEIEVRLPLTAGPVSSLGPGTSEEVSTRRILVVEDNPDAAEMLTVLLETAGHEVRVAGDGQDALDTLRRDSVDVVLCDIGLPGMSGYDVARTVRADPELRHLSLIALTGYGQPEDRRRSAAVGFDAHLTKPVDLAGIHEVLERLETG